MSALCCFLILIWGLLVLFILSWIWCLLFNVCGWMLFTLIVLLIRALFVVLRLFWLMIWMFVLLFVFCDAYFEWLVLFVCVVVLLGLLHCLLLMLLCACDLVCVECLCSVVWCFVFVVLVFALDILLIDWFRRVMFDWCLLEYCVWFGGLFLRCRVVMFVVVICLFMVYVLFCCDWCWWLEIVNSVD